MRDVSLKESTVLVLVNTVVARSIPWRWKAGSDLRSQNNAVDTIDGSFENSRDLKHTFCGSRDTNMLSVGDSHVK